jgi:hypothetical protein
MKSLGIAFHIRPNPVSNDVGSVPQWYPCLDHGMSAGTTALAVMRCGLLTIPGRILLVSGDPATRLSSVEYAK